MDINNIKISACVLSRNDSQLIKDCINHISPYVDEIVILDSSDDNKTDEIIKNIDKSRSPPIIYKKGSVSHNVAEDRNYIQSLASGDYVLHIDCDERFDQGFLQSMKNIIIDRLSIRILPILFRLPRINQPDRINYPDYQIRLLNRRHTRWVGKVHETPEILPTAKLDAEVNKMKIYNLTTLDYDTIHIYKDKDQLQIRWKDLKSKENQQRRLLFIMTFKDSNLWAREVLSYIYNLYSYNSDIEDKYKLNMNFSFIDGDSKDGTFDILSSYTKEECILNIQLRRFEPKFPKMMVTADKFIRFKILATVRNYAIEQSISGFPLNDDDYIMFADGDVKFGDNIVHDLIKDMEMCGADIIAPMIYIENFREFGNSYFYDILAFKSLDGTRFAHQKPYFNNLDMNKPNQVNSVGSFYLMKYKVAKQVKYSGDSDSEQVEFCNRARSQGFKIFVSPRLSVFHINFEKYGMKVWR